MRLLKDDEAALAGRRVEALRAGETSRSFTFNDIAAFFVLARTVMNCWPPQGCILYVDEWGIWPSSENWSLFDDLCRLHFGETHRVKPMRFAATELDTATTFLHLVLEFGWGAAMMADGGSWFRFNHDGFATLHCDNVALPQLSKIPGVTMPA